MKLSKICRNAIPNITGLRHTMLGDFSKQLRTLSFVVRRFFPAVDTEKSSHSPTESPKCHECVHFQHGFPTYSKEFKEYSYGKCNRIYNRNSIETYFSPPAGMARRHSDLCGMEGKFFISRTNYLTNYYASS